MPVAKRTTFRRIRRWILIALAILVVGPFAVILPLNLVQPFTTSVMLWRAGERLAQGKRPVYPRRDVVRRDEISPLLRRAVLAAEDDRFYLHDGFDFKEIESALERARAGRRLRGASTISQQVAKNLFLWEGRSYVRKGLEAWLTVVLELCVPKERILDLYLNLAEWGDGVFGAEAAARYHFGASASALGPEQAAYLAAVLPSPRRYERAKVTPYIAARVDTILARMDKVQIP